MGGTVAIHRQARRTARRGRTRSALAVFCACAAGACRPVARGPDASPGAHGPDAPPGAHGPDAPPGAHGRAAPPVARDGPGTAGRPADLRHPRWTCPLPAGIAWTETFADGPDGAALAVCDGAGRLHVIDAAGGELRGGSAIPIGAAMRPARRPPADPDGTLGTASNPADGAARSADDVLYSHDPFTLCAVDVRGGRLLWRVGAWPAAGEQQRRDPESLARIAAAHACGGGVLVARDDGLVGLLERDDGAARWTVELPPMPACDLHVHGRHGMLVRTAGGLAAVTRFEWGAGPPAPRTQTLEGWVPIRTLARGDALLLIELRRIAALAFDGAMRSFQVPPDEAIQSASVRTVRGPGVDAVFFLTRGGWAYLLDGPTLTIVWRRTWSGRAPGPGPAAAPAPPDVPEVTHASAELLVTRAGVEQAVLFTGTGAGAVLPAGAGEALPFVWTDGRHVRRLLRATDNGRDALVLETFRMEALRDAAERGAALDGDAADRATVRLVGLEAEPHRVHPFGRVLVIEEPRRLVSFALP